MVVGIAFLVSVVLFGGFLALTAREAQTGARLFARFRDALDARVEDLVGSFAHLDLPSIIVHFLREVGKRAAHDLAHVALAGVEALQAALRRLVVRLRTHHAPERTMPHPFAEYMGRVKKPRVPQMKADSARPTEPPAQEATTTLPVAESAPETLE